MQEIMKKITNGPLQLEKGWEETDEETEFVY